MAHPDGEVAAARAAQAADTVFILSTISTSSIEEVAEAAHDAIKRFQLYIYRDREVERRGPSCVVCHNAHVMCCARFVLLP